MIRKLLLLAVLCVPLSCGFHLRGTIELPAQITPLYVAQYSVDNALSREIRNLLSQSSADSLAETLEAAVAELTIVSARIEQRVVAVDNRGRVRQYELGYRVSYSVSGKNRAAEDEGATAAKTLNRKVHLKRDLLFDPDSVLAIGHEQEKLYQDMRTDAARLILQQLKALGRQGAEE